MERIESIKPRDFDWIRTVSPWYSERSLLGYVFRKRLCMALQMTDPSDKIVLDAGFGYGPFLPVLKRYTNFVYGIDVNATRVDWVSRKLEESNINITRQNLIKTNFPDKFFDVVYCLDVLEHIQAVEDAFFEISRILKPKGILLASLPTENTIYQIGRRFFTRTTWVKEFHHHDSKDIRQKILKEFEIKRETNIFTYAFKFFYVVCARTLTSASSTQ